VSSRNRSARQEVPLHAKVAFLRRAASFAEQPATVEAIETHMSWVFLTEQHAYKLKKPVRTDLVDFGSGAARRRHCEAEVSLNRRLAPGVYLATVPLVADPAGRLRLGGRGRVVDWLVKMRRLPAEARLDGALARGEVDRGRLREALERLSAFYAEARTVATTPDDYVRRIKHEIGTDHDVLVLPAHRVPRTLSEHVITAQRAFLRDHGPLIEQRTLHLIEGHGDLRPEHVYLLAEPVVVDRLEFNRDLRIVDPVEELAFLAMECALLGDPSVGALAFDVYARRTGDRPAESIVAFYRSRRACVRARLAIWHLDDPAAPVASRWLDLAVRYLESAERDLARMPR
jgi:aminoglycoside phosphotransferase family enzyme